MERPALQRLLADVAAGRVKVIVVYKVDRLTRSLADFAKIIEILEANEVSFVSITQQFSTTTSMGRLTLNVLLSFAQFEREVTAERIRDKIAASKKKGMWMGGVVPLGYDVFDRKLIVNEAEAATVRTIFELYLEHGNTRLVKEAADRLGLRTKDRHKADGTLQGGGPFTRGHINKILINHLYIGEITHKGACYPGEHLPIINRDLWYAAQAQLVQNAVNRSTRSNAHAPSLLTSLIETGDGTRLTPSHASKRGQRYRYYVTKAGDGKNDAPWRLPAPELEKAIIEGVCGFLMDRQHLSARLAPDAAVNTQEMLFSWAAALATELCHAVASAQRDILLHILRRAQITEDQIAITLNAVALQSQLRGNDDGSCEDITIQIPITLRRRGVETRLVIENPMAPLTPDGKLVDLVVRAHRWFQELNSGSVASVHELGRRDRVSPGDISRTLQLAFLAPDIVEAILDGRHPTELTAARLKRMRGLPLDWQQQRRHLGFA